MQAEYWPWWVGGPLMALVALVFPLLVGGSLGVSGSLARVLRWRSERGSGAGGGSKALAKDRVVEVFSNGHNGHGGNGTSVGGVGSEPKSRRRPGAMVDRGSNLVFLVGIVAGGALAVATGGGSWGSLTYSPLFHRFFGTGVSAWVMLFGGGLLVGFGTRLAGGCTSGHGLSGCGRLQPASFAATGVFFGVAIVVSFLMEALRA